MARLSSQIRPYCQESWIMEKNVRTRGRATRIVQSLVFGAVIAFTLAACTGNGTDDAPNADATAAAEAATVALDAGLEAHAAGDLVAAEAAYIQVLTLDETNKFALYNLALIDEANANYGLAEAKYRSALESDAAYEPALFNLAILRTSADPQEAMSLYQRAVAADATDAAAWLNLGLLQRANGQLAAGDESVLRAIELNPALTDPAPDAAAEEPTTP
jgi:Tfp pilus assembly protein PilF